MKIAIEAQRLFRPKKHGMEIVALELIRQVQQLDNQNEYRLMVRPDADSECVHPTANFSIHAFKGYTYADWEQVALPRELRKFNPVFLHATCNTAPLNSRIPLLLHLHDIIYLEKIDFKGTAYQNFGNIYRRLVVPRAVKKSRIVITVSEYEREVIINRLQVDPAKVRVVYNAVNTRFALEPDRTVISRFRERHHLPDEFILFLGNTAPKKNTAAVISAFSTYCREQPGGLPLVMLDYDPDLVKSALEQRGDTALFSRFVFPGYVPPAEMPLMYNAASLFLYPSLRESFGLPILEAMGCGTPVITSTTSSMPEIAGDAGLLIDPYQPAQLAQAISTILSDDNLRKQCIGKGIQRAAAFTWEASARKLLSIYQEMAQ